MTYSIFHLSYFFSNFLIYPICHKAEYAISKDVCHVNTVIAFSQFLSSFVKKSRSHHHSKDFHKRAQRRTIISGEKSDDVAVTARRYPASLSALFFSGGILFSPFNGGTLANNLADMNLRLISRQFQHKTLRSGESFQRLGRPRKFITLHGRRPCIDNSPRSDVKSPVRKNTGARFLYFS